MNADFKSFFEGRYKEQVEWYSSRASNYKRNYVAVQWLVVVLSSTVPAMIAGASDDYKVATTAMSVLVAIGTAAIKTFKYQEIWLNYRTISETLKKEAIFYQHKLGDYLNSETPESLFIERVETLISRENSLWIISMKDEEKVQKSK